MLSQLSLIAEPNCQRSYRIWSPSSQRHEISCQQKVCPQRLSCEKLHVSMKISPCTKYKWSVCFSLLNASKDVPLLSGAKSESPWRFWVDVQAPAGDVGGVFLVLSNKAFKRLLHGGSPAAAPHFSLPGPFPPAASSAVVSHRVSDGEREFDLQP